MTDLQAAWDAEVAKVRLTGTRVSLSADASGPMGESWVEDGVPCIVVRASLPIEDRLFTLFHEIGHHVLGHTVGWSSQPAWEVEYAADRFAVRAMADIDPGNPHYEDLSRAHVRPLVQQMIDAGIWHHVDLTIADWAGCEVSRHARRMIEARR